MRRSCEDQLLELLYTPNSPYSRIVRVRILEQGLDIGFTRVALRESADRLLEFNPAGKVPTLKLDGGRTLSETRLICEYLDSLHPSDFLARPEDLDGRSLEGLATGFLDGIAVWIRELRRDRAEQSPGVLQLEGERFDRCMRYFEQMGLAAHGVGYAHTAIASAIELVDVRVSKAWRNECPCMSRWFDAISENACLRATSPLAE